MASPSLPTPALSLAQLIDDTQPRYRSGAAARMARIPVATLRTWERRFGVVTPTTAPSGHRFYSAADVHRLSLLKQLSDMGHPIGVTARLDLEQLREVAATHATIQAQTIGQPAKAAASTTEPWTVVLIGPTVAARMQRPAVLRELARPVEVIGPFDTLAQCLAFAPQPSTQTASTSPGDLAPASWRHAGLVLLETPTLRDELVDELRQVAAAWQAEQTALLCGYAMPSARDAAIRAGFSIERGPMNDDTLAEWLRLLYDLSAAARPAKVLAPPPHPWAAWGPPGPPTPRRFNDIALADFAAISSTVACECPRHVSELLIQLTAFEAYSADCASQSTDDADLHRYLQRATAAARAILETALERLAEHEGLLLKG
jgi:DNA-binding transcriptional MerR regulator